MASFELLSELLMKQQVLRARSLEHWDSTSLTYAALSSVSSIIHMCTHARTHALSMTSSLMCNPGTQEVKAGKAWVWGQSDTHSKLSDSLICHVAQSQGEELSCPNAQSQCLSFE